MVCDERLYGITSFGKYCDVYPNVFTKVSNYVSWISNSVISTPPPLALPKNKHTRKNFNNMNVINIEKKMPMYYLYFMVYVPVFGSILVFLLIVNRLWHWFYSAKFEKVHVPKNMKEIA